MDPGLVSVWGLVSVPALVRAASAQGASAWAAEAEALGQACMPRTQRRLQQGEGPPSAVRETLLWD